MTAAEALAWVAENHLIENIGAIVAAAPPLPTEVADIWWRVAHSGQAYAMVSIETGTPQYVGSDRAWEARR